MSNAGAVVAVLRLRKEREIVAALRDRAAVSEKAAATLTPSGGIKGSVLRSLVRNGAVRETGAGAFYLDEAAYAAMRSRRRDPHGSALGGGPGGICDRHRHDDDESFCLSAPAVVNRVKGWLYTSL